MSSEIRLADVGDERSIRSLARWLKQHPAYQVAKPALDAVKNSLPLALRMATNRFRHLPTVVIVGVERAGTRRLFANLLEHPRCLAAVEKEIDYFSEHAHRSVAWYRSRFPWRRRVLRRQAHVLEASPSYLPTPSALRKMQTVVPNARIIVVLRDPVERAFSHYQQNTARQLESRSFAAVVEEEIRTNAFPARWGVALEECAQPMSGYVARGYYALQLELLGKMYRRNRVLVLDSDKLFADTAATCNRVFDYMGLEDFDVAPTKMYDRGFYRDKIDPRVADRLRKHYRPYDEMLNELFEQSFGWMALPRAQAA